MLVTLAFGAPAVAAPGIGIGDQSATSFEDPRFRSLGVRYTRLVMPWDSVFKEPEALDRWMNAARGARLDPMVAFSWSRSDFCDNPCRAPGLRAYARAFEAFRTRYPWARTITVWNEANHRSQPTAHDPRRAAQYYDVAKRRCRSCTLVAADVLDSQNMLPWIAKFRRWARSRPRLWGLHNYSDTNRFRTTGTDSLLRAVPGAVWLTETGALTEMAKSRLTYDERRAARSMRFLLRRLVVHPRIRRVYLYQWRKTNPWDWFDAGLVRPDGTPRPAFYVVRNYLRARR